jgi:hypothetical protein
MGTNGSSSGSIGPQRSTEAVGGRLDIVESGSGSVGHAGSGGGGGGGGGGAGPNGRPFLQVFFKCANQYLRVNRNVDGTGYRAMCPVCGKRVNFVVGPGGTSERYFELSC